ncbi:type I restriction-modification system subunit M [Dehalococcoidia bacterium]|nr:type I restriction-modification system subunit M [Dehalococcoidia bacterium]
MTTINSQSSLDSKIYSICDIMRRGNLSGALEYIPELTWLLFLRILDEQEELEAAENLAVGRTFSPSIAHPYRWQDWASPHGEIRQELQSGMADDVTFFVNQDLLPHLKELGNQSSASSRQKVISAILSGVQRVRIDTERNFLEVLDRVDEIQQGVIDQTHIFTLSQAYEGLLLRMGEKNNDGGQFFTPREVIRAIVEVVAPKVGETIFDPGCGTGGFLAQSYNYIQRQLGNAATADQISQLSDKTFYGKEKADQIYPIALANLVLHGINAPNIWHGNTLTGNPTYDGLFQGAPQLFDVILMNPPFGGSEGPEAQTRYAYKTGSTQVLFMQEVIDSLKNGGRAGIVIDEGLLFRTNETSFVQTKRKLLDECDVYCIVSLPGGVFTQAGAGVKTNLIFFNKGSHTEKIWYYDLSNLKVAKRRPLTINDFKEFFELLPSRGESENSWIVTREEIEAKNYDLKAVNPNKKEEVDSRTPDDLLNIIENKGEEIKKYISRLRSL